MAFNLIHRQPLIRIPLEQAAEQVASLRAETIQDGDILLGDLLQNFVPRLLALHRSLLERIDAADHLVEEHAKGPPVDGEGMTVSPDDLGREILGRAAESIGHAVTRLLDLGKAKIGELQVTLRIEEDVLRFQVSVDDAILV